MKRHFKPDLLTQYRHRVPAAEAGWRYLSFEVVALNTGEMLSENTRDQEIAIVPIVGHLEVAYLRQLHVIGRDDLFCELTDFVYLPPCTDFRIKAHEACEVAIGRAPASGRLFPRLIRREETPGFIRGGANVQRGVNVLLDSDQVTERLVAFEIRPPSGNWSSFPPHRHDAREGSSYHEETYYFRLEPKEGFAIQRIYTRDTPLDVAVAVQDGDLVLVHEGYHAVVNAPGTNAYYLNFLAGDVRKMRPVNDPHYDWVSKRWDGKPIQIPV